MEGLFVARRLCSKDLEIVEYQVSFHQVIPPVVCRDLPLVPVNWDAWRMWGRVMVGLKLRGIKV